jgi:hypothetical protein
MRAFKTIVFALFLTLLSASQAQTNASFPDAVVRATKSGDSKALSAYFNDKIELIIPEKSGIFSKAQAEQVIRNFFMSYPVQDFKIIHQGVRDNSSFAIGKYVSKQGSFRFTYLLKDTDGSAQIHQLRIEKQDE